MKKRLFAAFTALIMLLSVFAFASCEDEPVTETSSEAESQQELTARELFTASLLKTAISGNVNENTLSDLTDFLFAKPDKDLTGKITFNVDKLSAEGVDLASLGKIGLVADVKSDIASQSVAMDYDITFLGETVDASLFIDNANKKVFMTNLLGAFEKPILILDESLISEESVPEIEINEIEDLLEDIVKAVTESIKDDAFVKTTETVTVDGKTIENATVITLTVDVETTKCILTEITESFNATENLSKLLGGELELNMDEIPVSTKIVNTIKDDKSVALSVTIESHKDTTDNSSESTNDTAVELSPVYDKFVINADYLDGNFNLILGPADDEGKFFHEHGYIKYTYRLENEKETCVFVVAEDGEEQTLIKLDGTNKNGEHKGEITFGADGNFITADYVFSVTENSSNIQIGPIAITSNGKTEEYEFLYTESLTQTETTTNANGKIEFSMEEEFELSASYEVSIKAEDITLEPVTDYIEEKDLDESKIESAFKEKCPLIYDMITGGTEDLVDHNIDDRFVLCLPDGFEEVSANGFTAAYAKDGITVLVLEEKFEDIGVELTLDDYISYLHDSVGDNASEIFDDSLPYFIYENSEYGMHYFVTAYEGEDSFWLLQYCCSEEDFNDYQERFLEWAYSAGAVYEHVDESF